MTADLNAPAFGDVPSYGRSVFEAILDGLGPNDPFRENALLNEQGVWIKDPRLSSQLKWHPLCELVAPGSPNPLDEPWLPFPFTARQLAALMVGGWGNFIAMKYGDWADGPSPNELKSIGMLGITAKEALVAAYAAYREAIALAPKLDPSLATAHLNLASEFQSARELARVREGLREPTLAGDERTARLTRVNASIQVLREQVSAAADAANNAECSWRRAVVQHLLLPINKVPTEAFRSQLLRALSAERRAQALHQDRAFVEFQESAEGEAYWAFVCEQLELETALRHWQLLSPRTVDETERHEAKLKELKSRLAEVKQRLRNWTWASTGVTGMEVVNAHSSKSSNLLQHEDAVDRQRRRLRDLRERFGGDLVFRKGAWGAKDRQSGAFKKLVSQEAGNGSINSSAKSVRADLVDAAEREAADKRAGRWAPGLT